MSRGGLKGGKFERDLCRLLSLWWTEGKHDDVFWRTAGSGSRAKTRSKTGRRTFGQEGDIQAVHPVGRPLLDLLTIEAKRGYSQHPAFECIDQKGISFFEDKFLRQTMKDASNAGTRFWMLIHQRDKRKACVFIPVHLYRLLAEQLFGAYPRMFLTTHRGVEIFCTTLDEWKNKVSPADIRRISARKVITVGR